ncbi:hypothetical protein MTsPCn9_10690 [Croceitalea sp. MTPC9]|nr:hypothetical protein MTsPCn6_26550 [Croceitalea sp. MTPC6]GMN16133.1 hypothetical protein MTsPCn9_10690 [Croceitalea sp. MTPC9]
MKNVRNSSKSKELKLETFKVMEMAHPEKIQGGGDGGWTVRKDKDPKC